MAVNKVVVNTPEGEQTLIDLTNDSVKPETLAEGATAHDASGQQVTGTMPQSVVLYTEQNLTPEQQTQARENIGVLEPLIGSTTDITPAQALTALREGRDIVISYTDATFGILYFNYFVDSPALDLISSGGIIKGTDLKLMRFTLTGFISSGRWSFVYSQLAEYGDIPVDTVSYGEQSLTKEQQEQARENIDAVSKSETFTIRQEVTPDYTNLFDIYGIEVGKQIDSTGALIDSTTCVSGFIPVKLGDVIRVKDNARETFGETLMVALYGEDKAESAGIGKTIMAIESNANKDYGTIVIDGNVATWTLEPINYYNWRNFAYMRVSTYSADAIVTVNEPLTESVEKQLILKPTVKVTKDSLEGDVSGKPLSGKTIVGFGDSIFGYVRDTTSVLSYVARETGATVHNVGFGGCRMSVHPTNGYAAFSMWALAKAIVENDWTTQDAQASSGSSYFPEHLALLKSIDFNSVDMVVINYGLNDFTAGNGVQIDNINDPDDYTTMCGALRYSIEKLLTAYPNLQIFIDLPTYRYWPDTGKYPDTYTNNLGKYYHEYVDALRSVASEYNLPVIDCYYGLGVNKLNVATMTSDGTHHSAIGRQRLGEFIAGYLNGRQAATMPIYRGEVV